MHLKDSAKPENLLVLSACGGRAQLWKAAALALWDHQLSALGRSFVVSQSSPHDTDGKTEA